MPWVSGRNPGGAGAGRWDCLGAGGALEYLVFNGLSRVGIKKMPGKFVIKEYCHTFALSD